MPLVPIRTAAQLVGKDRTTILRAIESGKLSATKSELGRYLIDPAELERVYGTLHTPPSVRPDASLEDAAATHTPALERELELMREMLERERTAHERERSIYDRDRETWAEEHTFLRTLIERRDAEVKLLTDQRERQEVKFPPLFRWFRQRT